jgi:hypothetical protein
MLNSQPKPHQEIPPVLSVGKDQDSGVGKGVPNATVKQCDKVENTQLVDIGKEAKQLGSTMETLVLPVE